MKRITNPTPKTEFKYVSWQNIKSEVKKVNPELANIINALPTKSLKFKLATYSYGAIIAQGTDKNKTPPVFLVLEKSCELFLTNKEQHIPFEIIKSGEICCAAQVLAKKPFGMQQEQWAISAGARNIFMLPKISDDEKHNRLKKKFNFQAQKPQNLSDQWEIFRLIANSGNHQSEWQCKILIFEDTWFKNYNKKSWKNFYYYFGNFAFQKSIFHINQYFIQFLLSALQNERPVRLTRSQTEQINHLLMLSMSGIPGYTVLTNNELLPLKLIQAAYSNIYKLENYPPIMVGPDYFANIAKDEKCLYYSYGYPCFYSFSPKENQSSSTARDFYQLFRVFRKVLDFIKDNNFLYNNGELKNLSKTHQLTFYHPGSKTYNEFSAPKLIPDTDKSIMQDWSKDKRFPHKVDFLNGCIQIKATQKDYK